MPTTTICLAIALPLIAFVSVAVITALWHRKRLQLTATTTPFDEEKQQLIMTTPGETPAGPPPMAWQADYGLIPQMGQPPPYMMGGGMGMGMGMPGMMMGGMGGMWPGGMNADGMGEPKPQYLPPGPMPYGGGMMGGYGGGMAPWGYGGMPP